MRCLPSRNDRQQLDQVARLQDLVVGDQFAAADDQMRAGRDPQDLHRLAHRDARAHLMPLAAHLDHGWVLAHEVDFTKFGDIFPSSLEDHGAECFVRGGGRRGGDEGKL